MTRRTARTDVVQWRKKLPADATSAVALKRGERVLGWVIDDADRYIVATEFDLILQRRPPAYERIGWESIDRVSYADGVLTITLVPDHVGADGVMLRIPAGDDPQLAIVVRDRVTSSIVLNEHVRLDGRKGIHVVARRRAGDDALRWGYVVDQGLPVDDDLKQRAEGLVKKIRLESGLGSDEFGDFASPRAD